MNKLLASIVIGCSALVASAAPSVLTLKNTITDNSIVYPESFETDTHKMMQNWYLQNYTVLNNNYSKTPIIDATDEVYIKRLSALPTNMEMPYNQVVRSYINMYTQRRRELVESMLGMSLYYMPIFEQALERHGLPLELRYLPVIESALNPDAVSRAGATGLWQFMLPTARGLGMEISTLVDERRDPYVSSEAAATYLEQLYNMYHDWSLVIAAYNCGPGNINKALRRAGGENKDYWNIYYLLPAETRGYVPAFIAANYVMNYYNQHNISPALARRPILTDTIHVNKRVHFRQISDVLNIPVEELRVLNPQYRQDIIPGDVRPYALVLPSMQVYSYIMSEDSIVAHDAQLYARRAVVNPTTEEEIEGETEYATKLVTKTHKVKRGETLTSVAKKYGVSTSDIKKWNGLKKNALVAGKTLKIQTYQRVAVGKKKPAPKAADQEIAANDQQTGAAQAAKASEDGGVEVDVQDAVEVEEITAPTKPGAKKETKAVASEPVAKVEKTKTVAQADTKKSTKEDNKKKSKKETAAKNNYKLHTVKKGESLYRIAQQYKGVSVEDIQKLNGISGKSKIQAGQKIKIPRS
jgi:membrane-bound lytic murein transglycosylase D